MTRRIPVFSTVIVLLAVATMVALGFWQLGRKAEKEAVLAHYERARTMSSEVPWPRSEADYPATLYRHAQIARCRLADGGAAAVALGWSPGPEGPSWQGGLVGGFIGPAGKGIRLVAAPAQAGLDQLAPPDPANIPNNHLSYAVQWFFFAATALVIYALALRRRQRGG